MTSVFTEAERAVYAERKWTKPRCDVCRQPLTSVKRSALVFDFWKPDAKRRGAPFIAHYECFDDAGTYMICLDRIRDWGNDANPYAVRDSVCMWRAHLGDKDWWYNDIATDLVRAWGFAMALAERVRGGSLRVNPSPSLRARVLERDGFKCRRCGSCANDCRLVVDHITPVAKGGRTTIDNLQTLCADCNTGKRDREPHPHDMRGLV